MVTMTAFIDSTNLVLIEHRLRLDEARHDVRRDTLLPSPSRRWARKDRRGGRPAR